MAITEYYVGDGGNDSTGDGTSHATRWLTIQKALDTMTQANLPIRLNVRGLTTAEGGWDFTSHASGDWPTTQDDFMIIQGYDTVAGDGTVATIDSNAVETVNDVTKRGLFFRDLEFSNWGTGTAFSLDNYCGFFSCKFDGEGARKTAIDADLALVVMNCEFVNFALDASFLIAALDYSYFAYNYFEVESATASDNVIQITNGVALNNIISLNTTTDCNGIKTNGSTDIVDGNSILNKAAGTGSGIYMNSAVVVCVNNLVEGFSGTGGVGIEVPSGGVAIHYSNNAVYDCDTEETLTGEVGYDADNETPLSASPFAKTGSDTFANRYAYFAPVDTDNVHGGAYQ